MIEIWQLKPNLPGIKLCIPYMLESSRIEGTLNYISLEFRKFKNYEITPVKENLLKGLEEGYLIKSDNWNKKARINIETLHKYFYFINTKHQIDFNKKMDKILE